MGFKRIVIWGVGLLGVALIGLFVRSHVIMKPIASSISSQTSQWGTPIDLTPGALRIGESVESIEKALSQQGFTQTTQPYHQFIMCLNLAKNNAILGDIGAPYIEKCKDAKMDFVRRRDNMDLYADENGRPIYETVFSPVYERKRSEFPCNVRYVVYPFYDAEMKLVAAIGMKNESGCL